ncbi:hypothetical protein SAMN05421643_1572 [Acinetobacter kyonggiensis]|uniref:Uncharacterized protein n=1 Tax=Acinetobacter kyonggiensis TaxID=595670 RepID=A0A1H3NPQ0_9GAMM|nr:hypothetical protein SAMN05421643_1572 [Acinetobacter kyonggiensis]
MQIIIFFSIKVRKINIYLWSYFLLIDPIIFIENILKLDPSLSHLIAVIILNLLLGTKK